jgi:hypothetical protein
MYAGAAAGGNVRRYLPEPLNIDVKLSLALEPKLSVRAPKGYIVPASRADVIELLKLHGVRTEPVATARKEEFTTYRLLQPRFASAPFEGRFLVNDFELKQTRDTLHRLQLTLTETLGQNREAMLEKLMPGLIVMRTGSLIFIGWLSSVCKYKSPSKV